MSRVTVNLIKNEIVLHCPYQERHLAKSIAGRRWDNELKAWRYPARPETLQKIQLYFPGADISPQVKEAILQAEQQESAVSAAKAAGWEAARPLASMNLKPSVIPFQHQILAFNVGVLLPNVALLMEQGCGKTLTAIAVLGYRFLRGEIKRAFIVAPSSVIPVWPKEFADYADYPVDVYELTGPIEKRASILDSMPKDPSRLQVAITNYEATWRMEDKIRAWGPDAILCDESQRIKTPSAQQSKAMHRLGRIARYRMILTGTPVTQAPLDFFSQYKFLEPSIFGTSFWPFRNKYALMGGYQRKQVIGYQNLDDLTRKAHSIAFRVTKEEALDLPAYIDQQLYCELEPKAQSIYRQMAKESVAELDRGGEVSALNVLSRLLRLSQITGGFVGDDEGITHKISDAKLSLLKETINDLLVTGKKVVVFARFLAEINDIKKWLEATGIGYAYITGSVAGKDRGEMVRRFQEEPNCKVFVAQIQTAGLGITLTAADTAIFYSLDYSFANYDQCRARIHRIGQRNACTYIHLVAKNTVDTKVMAALRAKRDLAAMVVDRWRELFE